MVSQETPSETATSRREFLESITLVNVAALDRIGCNMICVHRRFGGKRLVVAAAVSLWLGCTLTTSLDGLYNGANGSDGASAVTSEAGGQAGNGVRTCQGAGDPALCVPGAPNGWTGPLLLSDVLVGAEARTCPGSIAAYAGYAGLDAGAVSCGACSCGSPVNVQCSAPQVETYNNLFSCSALVSASDLSPGVCSNVSGSWSKMRISGSSRTGGSCLPSGGEVVSLPPAGWASAVRACNAVPQPAGSCPSGQTCMLAPPPGFLQGKYCVLHDGDVSCPGVGFVDKHTYYGSFSDTRGCAACKCTFSDQGCDTTALRVLINTDCTDAGVVVSVPSACLDNGGGKRVQLLGTPTPPAACIPSGGPTGQVTPTDPTTICCTP
jgi:hypothetical protein